MVDTNPSIFTEIDVRSHNSAKTCYVTLGSKVYDVTSFLNDHPGGADIVLEYGGTDIKKVMENETLHRHSEAAYEILQDYLIGSMVLTSNNCATSTVLEAASKNDSSFVYSSTGLSREEDLSVETNFAVDYRTHKFLDLNRPLLPQLWYGNFAKDFYLQQVHRPRHYKGGNSAPIFGNALEPLTKTAWFVVPIVWLPPVIFGTFYASSGLQNPVAAAGYWLLGLFLWTLIEYGLHRFLFHMDEWLPDNKVGISLHFLLHGVHHYLPMDKYRLVLPPTVFVILGAPFYKLAHVIIYYNWYAAVLAYCGGVFGYICYDMTHYFLHHRKSSLPSYYQSLKKYHLQHHFADFENGFGVSSQFWDRVFGTGLRISPSESVKIE
ncbi:fatty acid hydroxylase [Penicillium lividum]|nr:fatty acid hydroxylase [Penicillium lividum]